MWMCESVPSHTFVLLRWQIIWLLPRSKGHIVSSNRCRSPVLSGVSMSDLQGLEGPTLNWPSWVFSHGGQDALKRLPHVNTNKGSHLLAWVGVPLSVIYGPKIHILNAPKIPQETRLEKIVTVCKKDKLPIGRSVKHIQWVEEITGVKVTLTPNTGVNLAHTECFMKTLWRLNAEHFHPASIKN